MWCSVKPLLAVLLSILLALINSQPVQASPAGPGAWEAMMGIGSITPERSPVPTDRLAFIAGGRVVSTGPEIAGIPHWFWYDWVTPKPLPDEAQERLEPKSQGALPIHWDQVDTLFPVGTVALVRPVGTGLTFKVWRRGGWAHADVEPLKAQDTEVMRQVYGQWSWARVPIVVEVGGQRIAASMHGMPHGQQAIKDNGFPGHFCIHFTGSTTHGSSYTSTGVPMTDRAHQAAVRQAVGQ